MEGAVRDRRSVHIMNDDYEQGVRDESRASHRGDVGRVIRLVIAAAFVALVIVMGSDNRTKVRVGYPGGHRVAAMWIVSVGASIAGVIIGWLIKHRPHHKI